MSALESIAAGGDAARNRQHDVCFPARLLVPNGRGLDVVEVDSIHWVEAAGNYVRLHLGPSSRLFRGRISELEKRLDPARFVRVHRSAIVNSAHVKAIVRRGAREAAAELCDGSSVPVSRNCVERLVDVIGGA